MLLSVIGLAVTELAGVTHLFPGRQGTSDASKAGSDPRARARPTWNGWPADAPPPAIAPFDAAQARAHQEAWAKHLGMPVELTNSIGMKFVLIPPGKFTMGSSQKEIDFWRERTAEDPVNWVRERLPGEGPEHAVEITRPYYLGQTEVTVGQFRHFVKVTGYRTQAEQEGGAFRRFPNGEWKMDADTNWLNPGFAQTDHHPVVCVSWNEAVEFCNWLSKQEGKNYRLPTEAEWEYSCRAGSKGRWASVDNEGEPLKYARICFNSQLHTWPVAGLKKNAWGLHDMHGNVWEWCRDEYDADYYQRSPPKDPPGPTADGMRVMRGGGWECPPEVCRSAFRHADLPGARYHNFGFRVVLVVSPPASVRTESGAKDKPSSTAIAPFTDADIQRIAALPAEEQVEEVRKELLRRNPGFDGKVQHKIEDGVVTEFWIVTDQVTDIGPIRAFNALRVLQAHGTWTNEPNGLLADLTPLEGMNLAGLRHLSLENTKVRDLSPLKGVPLTSLRLSGCRQLRNLSPLKGMPLASLGLWVTQVQDLSPLKGMRLIRLDLNGAQQVRDLEPLQGMPLAYLRLDYTQVRDLTPLKGMPLISLTIAACTQVRNLTPLKDLKLSFLHCAGNSVSDLSPLKGMDLQDIRLTPKNITQGLDMLREMKSLKTIGIWHDQSWPAAEFWERYDNGEFTGGRHK